MATTRTATPKQPELAHVNSVHAQLAPIGLVALPHECSEPACTGGFQWKGYSELVSAARYAMNTGQLPPEALAMLKAALFKIDTAAPILEDKGLHREILV
jgi:hypothetical protein